MVLLTGLLGALTYAEGPALQARVIGLSHTHAPQAPAVAAWLNIAGFNGGIALGGALSFIYPIVAILVDWVAFAHPLSALQVLGASATPHAI